MSEWTSDEQFNEAMRPLFERARREGLWFYTNYQDMWFTPDELAARHANRQLRWGPVNWQLRDPRALTAELERAVVDATAALARHRERLKTANATSPP